MGLQSLSASIVDLKHFFRRMAGISAEVLFPAICCECGRFFKVDGDARRCQTDMSLSAQFSRLMATYFCSPCGDQFHSVRSPLCLQCGQPFDSPIGPDHLCGQCLEHPFSFQAARAAGLYQGALRSAIHHFKYQSRDNMGKPLGQLLWQALGAYWDPALIDHVVPVPLHGRRLRRRGFNQAHALIREWPHLAAQGGLRTGPDWVDTTLLKRHRPTHPQTGLKKEERRANLRNAISVTNPQRAQNKRILLVDDVFTTGTTANACTQALLKAGAAEVRVLTLARTVL